MREKPRILHEGGGLSKRSKRAARIPHELSTIVSFLIAESVALNYFHFPQYSALTTAASLLVFVKII